MVQRYYNASFFLYPEYIYSMNLVTGATGFLGTHLLAKLILQKERSIAIFRSEQKKKHSIDVLLKYDAITSESISENIKWEKRTF